MLLWIVKLRDFLLVTLFPIFGFIIDSGELKYLVLIPIFGWTKERFIFIPIPSIFIFQNCAVYSVIFCYHPSGFFSLFLILFIRNYEKKNEGYTHTIWIVAPLLRYDHDSNDKKTFFFFIPTLSIYFAKDNKRFISVAYFMIGYLYSDYDEFEFIWFLPFFFYYKTKTTIGLLLLVALFNYQQSIDKSEDEKETIYSYRSWLLPLYYFSTSKSQEETKSIFVYIFPIFFYKSPGGLLKNFIRGSFTFRKYTITNHFLFLSFKVCTLNTELHLILFGLIGYQKTKDQTSVSQENPYNQIEQENMFQKNPYKPKDYEVLDGEISDEDLTEGSKLIDKENDFVETSTYWIFLMIYSIQKNGNKNTKTYCLLPIVYYEVNAEKSDLFFMIFLTRIKYGNHKLFTIYGLFYLDNFKDIQETTMMILFFYSFAIIKYEYKITRDSQNIQLSKSLFYIYFLFVYEYYESHLKLKGNSTFEKETYPSKLFIAVAWIWQHFGLISIDYHYIDHEILISFFLLFRYHQDEGYLSYKSQQKRRKMKQLCFLWFFHPYASLIRLEILYEKNTYQCIFCLAFLLYYKFEEIIKSLLEKTSMISYEISLISILIHPVTSLIHFSKSEGYAKEEYLCRFFPFFGFSNVELKSIKADLELEGNHEEIKSKSRKNLWILFLLRYKSEDDQTILAVFPAIPFDSHLTFWLTLIRFVNLKNSVEFRFLYRLILYQYFREEDKMNLEINPWMNIEKNSEFREINFIGGIFGHDAKGCKFCCCIHCCSYSRKHK
jgi:hypothetical protein